MYRITFDPKLGKFVIQICKLQCFWVNAADWQFDNYDHALAHVKQIGLDKLYQDKSANVYQAYMAEGNNMRRLMV